MMSVIDRENPLYAPLSDAQFQCARNTLLVLRANHPGHRDEELLFFALAAACAEAE